MHALLHPRQLSKPIVWRLCGKGDWAENYVVPKEGGGFAGICARKS